MLNLPTPATILQVVTGSAVTSIAVHATWVDLNNVTSAVTPGSTDTVIGGAATTIIVAAPAASVDRNVKFLSIQNEDPALSCDVTVQHFDGVNTVNLFSIVLLPGYTIQYNSDGSGFVVYDNEGNILVRSSLRGIVGIGAGTQTATSGTVILSNSNGISFGMSNSSVVTASYTQSTAPAAISAGTTLASSGTVIFSNSHGVSFGMAGQTVTASVNVSALDLAAIAAGTQTATSGTVFFANSNNVSFGMSGSSQVTASFALNLSAGTTSNNLSAVTLSNSNNVSFGLNGSVVTASAGAPTVSVFSQDADFVTNWPAGQASLSFQKLSLPMNLNATVLALIADLRGSSNSSDAVTFGHAVYTLSSTKAVLASSASRLVSWTSGSNTAISSQYGGASGTRYRSMSVSYALSPGDYVFGWSVSTANGANVNVFGRVAMNLVGSFDGLETTAFLNGISSSSAAAFPASFAATDTGYVRTGFSALRQPGGILLGS